MTWDKRGYCALAEAPCFGREPVVRIAGEEEPVVALGRSLSFRIVSTGGRAGGDRLLQSHTAPALDEAAHHRADQAGAARRPRLALGAVTKRRDELGRAAFAGASAALFGHGIARFTPPASTPTKSPLSHTGTRTQSYSNPWPRRR